MYDAPYTSRTAHGFDNERAPGLPTRSEPWPLASASPRRNPATASLEEVRRYAAAQVWRWPSHPIIFLCDLHADTDAFLLSLLASGGIERTGAGDTDYRLTDRGREATFIIGGDCFDKGPANLRLLRCLKHLIDMDADVSILAGNHDLRIYLGLHYAGRRETRLQHLFARMGKKSVALFAEIREAGRQAGEWRGPWLEDAEVRRRLFPDAAWYAEFETHAAGFISPLKLKGEVERIAKKCRAIELACRRLGLGLGELYAALARAQHMFLQPRGEFAWYFERMTLARQEGSFLFVHAGVDDSVARLLESGGVPALNSWYRRLFATDLFQLYHGPVGNVVRTKYRDIDPPLTPGGVAALHLAGVHAIVHGHRSLPDGQRLTLRGGVLHFECDASVDCNTRAREGLLGPGGAAVIIQPDGVVQAISTDYPSIKSLDGARAFEPESRRTDKSESGPRACLTA
jgi:hypothetical protein